VSFHIFNVLFVFEGLFFISLLIVGALCQKDENSKEDVDQEPVKTNQTISKKERSKYKFLLYNINSFGLIIE
jgi:hypothetical protein